MNALSREMLLDDDPEFSEVLRAFLDGRGAAARPIARGIRTPNGARHPSPQVLVIDITPARVGETPRCRVMHPPSDVSARILEAIGSDDGALPESSGTGSRDFATRTLDTGKRPPATESMRRPDGSPLASNDSPPGRTARFAGFALDLARRRLASESGDTVVLPPAEFELLLTFLEHPRQVLTREELAPESCRTKRRVTGRTLDVYVSRLRRHLGAGGAELIVTRHGQGYLFSTNVAFE